VKHRRRPASFARLQKNPARDGVALAVVLIAMLLVAALIAGAFNAATEETRMAVAAAGRQTALLNAESAIEVTIGTFSTTANDPMTVGETRDRSVDGLGAPVVVHVTRLDSALYWLVADAGGPSPGSGIARRIGVLVRAKRGSAGSITVDRIRDRGWSELF
jgi:type II secretory pathway pseudopilin PulG